MSASDKTVVHVYLDKSFGFGDYLRGSICIAQEVKRYNFNLKLDVSGHPIHHYMANVEVFQPSTVHKLFHSVDPIETMAKVLDEFKASKDRILYIATNFFYNAPALTQEVKDYVNSSLKWKEEYYTKAYLSLPLPCYSVLHIRCSDDNFINMGSLIESIANLSLEHDTLVLSSDYAVKKKLENKYGYFVLDNKPSHCAFSTDVAELESVVTDYIILSKSKSTTCISFYGHGSGFSEQCSVLHNIPYKVIVQEDPAPEQPAVPNFDKVCVVEPTRKPPPELFKANTQGVMFNKAVQFPKKDMPRMSTAPARRSFKIF